VTHGCVRRARFQDAASQLGNTNAAVRLAGVYAMARLADDWPHQRQTCVDVLCAYLRMPIGIDSSANPDAGDIEVRRSIVASINRRVSKVGVNDNSWSDCDFDFTGATLTRFDLRDAIFRRSVRLDNVRFEGQCRMNKVTFTQRPYFMGCTIAGQLAMTEFTFESDIQMRISRWVVEPDAYFSFVTCMDEHSAGHVVLDRLRVKGTFQLSAGFAAHPQPKTEVALLELDGGTVRVTTLQKVGNGTSYPYLPEVEAYRWKFLASGGELTVVSRLLKDNLFQGRAWEGLIPDRFQSWRRSGPNRPTVDSVDEAGNFVEGDGA